jgi:chloramphenicol-sensitive protein RarD
MDNKGLLSSFGACFIWGFFPIYWKLLNHVPALQLLGHRIAWSFILLVIIVPAIGNHQEWQRVLGDRKVMKTYATAALLIGLNWFIYVWAVNAGHIIDASLGYFINPLFTVFLGVLFFKERLRPLQWIAIGLAASGVAYLTIMHGRLPWIGLSLTLTFGLYGLAKKIATLHPLRGLTLETGFLFLPAVLFLIYQNVLGQGAFLHTGTRADLLMAGAGLVTTIPLLLFSYAAQRIPLSIAGLMHFITPTCQLLIGVIIYHESFDITRATGFGIVWIGLLVFIGESLWRHKTPATQLFSEFEG